MIIEKKLLDQSGPATIRIVENAVAAAGYWVMLHVWCKQASGAGSPILTAALAWVDGYDTPLAAAQNLLALPGSAPFPRSLSAVGRAKSAALVFVSPSNNLDLIFDVQNPAGSPLWDARVWALVLPESA